MEPFIRNDQYNVIKEQAELLAKSHATVVDAAVLNALESLALEKVLDVFSKLTPEQKQLLSSIVHVTGQEEGIDFFRKVRPYLIPFPEVTEQTLNELFPKFKKLKPAAINNVDLKEVSYLSWIDKNSNKKFLVTQRENELVGLQGTFTQSNQQGICTLCHSQEEVGMFVTGSSSGRDEFITRGNYICKDSQICNNNITTLENLNKFVDRVFI